MKLFYMKGACALHPQIVAREAGLSVDLICVDPNTKQLADGRALKDINPKGQIPALETSSGEILTEGIVISQYLADTAEAFDLLPPVGLMSRYRVLEASSFIAAELHQGFGPLFSETHKSHRAATIADLKVAYDYTDQMLVSGAFLTGDAFTVADAYLFNILTWSDMAGFALADWPQLNRFFQRIAERPHVQAAMRAEGLKPPASVAA